MKRTIGVGIIVAFLLTLCVLEQVLVKNTLQKINQNANSLYDTAIKLENVNTNEILKESEKILAYWEKNEDLLCFFVNHKDMHEMGNEIIKTISYCKNNIKEEFLTSLELVIYFTSTFDHIMGVSLQNIF
ncbi:MAG: DUF4363 family protein [Clostridiales bacterium]|nr:DUF4363 family protein [Clostridiales bacterium]